MPHIPKWRSKKDRIKLCPRCWHSMRYISLAIRKQLWAPFEWAWRCDRCPQVFWLDGSINPQEKTPEKRIQIRERKMLYSAIKHISFSYKISITQLKEAQDGDPGPHEHDDDLEDSRGQEEDDERGST